MAALRSATVPVDEILTAARRRVGSISFGSKRDRRPAYERRQAGILVVMLAGVAIYFGKAGSEIAPLSTRVAVVPSASVDGPRPPPLTPSKEPVVDLRSCSGAGAPSRHGGDTAFQQAAGRDAAQDGHEGDALVLDRLALSSIPLGRRMPWSSRGA